MTSRVPEASRLLLNPTTTTIVSLPGDRSEGAGGVLERAADVLQRCANVLRLPFVECVIGVDGDEQIAGPGTASDRIVLPSADVDPWHNTSLAELLGDVNRDQLVLVGDLSGAMLTFLAIGALGKGLDVFVIVEPDALSHRFSLAELRLKRLQQFGVVAVDVRQAVIELMRDWSDPEEQVSARSILGKAGM